MKEYVYCVLCHIFIFAIFFIISYKLTIVFLQKKIGLLKRIDVIDKDPTIESLRDQDLSQNTEEEKIGMDKEETRKDQVMEELSMAK